MVTKIGSLLCSARMSRVIHARMVFSILHAKVGEFLERMPFGRILNRFTADIDKIDRDIPSYFERIILVFFLVLLNVVFFVYSLNSLIAALPIVLFIVLTVVYWKWYINSKRNFTRMANISRSPMVGWSTSLV